MDSESAASVDLGIFDGNAARNGRKSTEHGNNARV